MKKALSLIIVSALLTVLLAACGSSNEKPESTAAPTNGENQGGKPVTISFMHFKSDFTDGVAKIVEQFETENPLIKVNVQPVKYDDYYTLLKTKLASGDIVDVFTLNAGAQTKLFSDGGYLEDLTGKPFLADFEEAVLKSQSTDGKNYVMPVNANPIAVFYNKQIFTELGIEIPRTYDALIEAGKKIKEAGKTPFALGWKDPWTLSMWLSRDMPSNSALVNNQPDFFEKLETGSVKFADNPATRTMIEHAQQLFELGNKDQLGVDYNGAVDLFAKGDVGMMYMGTWPLADIQKKNPDLYNNMGYFPYPFSNDESLNKLEFNPDASIAINTKSPNKEAAEKFLAFLASKEGGDLWVKNLNSLSYVKGTDTNIAPAVNDLKPYFDSGEMYDSQLYLAKTTIDWGTPFTQSLQKLFFKKSTIDQVIQEMDDWIAKNHN
ncbi:ABC transporter substrate-binding protein [Paenibacillus gorillae]|uniref:ABC transporter substrate-binding protein n=1 Tax=Paenibacillus gorillae TaxID=1243662 RepID=UPI0004AFDE81|nr:extracellular solute-binding protein [Paenibacillus gorillae]